MRQQQHAQTVGHREGDRKARQSWRSGGKRPVLRFVIVLVVLLGAFNYVYYVAFVRGDLLRPHLETTARLTGGILRVLGNDVRVSGTSVSSSRFSMGIDNGCDALQAVAFYVFAVVASPMRVSLLARAVSIVLGSLLLVGVNLVRIASLYYVGVYYPNAFETVHIEVWQTMFVFLPIFLWLIWVWWVIRRSAELANATV